MRSTDSDMIPPLPSVQPTPLVVMNLNSIVTDLQELRRSLMCLCGPRLEERKRAVIVPLCHLAEQLATSLAQAVGPDRPPQYLDTFAELGVALDVLFGRLEKPSQARDWLLEPAVLPRANIDR